MTANAPERAKAASTKRLDTLRQSRVTYESAVSAAHTRPPTGPNHIRARRLRKAEAMTDELRQALQQIREATPKLNKATDEAAQLVKVVDDFLAEQGVGLPVQVIVESGETTKDEEEAEPYHSETLCLSYKRCGRDGKFHIAVEREFFAWRDCDGYGEPDNPTVSRDVDSWSLASREDKLKTFAELPELLTEIAKQVTNTVKSTVEATKAVERIREAIAIENDSRRKADRLQAATGLTAEDAREVVSRGEQRSRHE